MGTITPYETAGGTRYRVRYRKPNNQQTDRRGFATKRDAKAFLASVEVSKLQGKYVDPADSKATIGDLGAERLQRRQSLLKPSTWASEESAWRNHVEPVWGSWRLDTIRHSDIQGWVSELTARRSPTTVRRAHGVLYGILDDATRDQRISRNPALHIKLPRKRPSMRRYLTHQQVDALASAAGHRSVVVYTLAYTGLRWGELVALRVRHIDFLRRRILVEDNAPTVRGTISPGTPKSHERRSVAAPQFLLDLLSQQSKGRPRAALLFGDGYTHYRESSSKDGWFRAAVRLCQRSDASFPYITPHALRHTAASLAISAGANVKAVQRMLGHASAAMTLDTYADLFEDDLDDVASALGRARDESTEKNVGKMWANR